MTSVRGVRPTTKSVLFEMDPADATMRGMHMGTLMVYAKKGKMLTIFADPLYMEH